MKNGTADSAHAGNHGPERELRQHALFSSQRREARRHCMLMPILEKVCLVSTVLFLAYPSGASAQTASPALLSILYPKHQSEVGKRVNVVLDPATDWSDVPLFQVRVGSTSYPVIDTSSGRHALQGVALQPGMNTITVSALAPAAADGSKKGGYRTIAAQTVAIYSRDGGFAVAPPAFSARPFHAPVEEAPCAGCHRLEVGPEDLVHDKPEDVLCFGCHREIPLGKHIHGPAAVWNCLACHDPDQRPVRYQFGSMNPWKVERSTTPATPAVFTLSGTSLFAPGSATFLSDAVPPQTKDREREIQRRKEQERALFRSFLEHMQQYPGERILVEAHVDKTALPAGGALRTHQQLTAARARAVAGFLGTYGISGTGRVLAKGLGSSLPKTGGSSARDRELNDRIELVAYPPDITVPNSRRLPSSAEHAQVTVTISRTAGDQPIRDIRIRESLPTGARYVRGTGVLRGEVREPLVKGSELEWSIDRLGSTFQERLTYMIKKTRKGPSKAGGTTKVRFREGGTEGVREFGAAPSTTAVRTVQKVCADCHGSMAAGPYTHGPVAAGYCTLCHDPHASNYSAWTRMESWRLCTTCHGEKRADKHLIRGSGTDIFHPTRKRPDPLRPGKGLACESCHAPHASASPELLAFEVRDTFELCRLCHPKK